jgi:hypothetical protein
MGSFEDLSIHRDRGKRLCFILCYDDDYDFISVIRVVFGTEQKNSISPFLTRRKKWQALTPLTSDMYCDQTAMGLPPLTSLFLIAK